MKAQGENLCQRCAKRLNPILRKAANFAAPLAPRQYSRKHAGRLHPLARPHHSPDDLKCAYGVRNHFHDRIGRVRADDRNPAADLALKLLRLWMIPHANNLDRLPFRLGALVVGDDVIAVAQQTLQWITTNLDRSKPRRLQPFGA